MATEGKRSTRIDKDVKTTARSSRLVSVLYDTMWSFKNYINISVSLLILELIASCIVIQKAPVSTTNWKHIMTQVSLFKAGERDYSKIKSITEHVHSPAGFLYIFSILHTITDSGSNIITVFLVFYLLTLAAIMAINYRSRALPPWTLIFLCISKRLHSIYLLRLAGEGIAMLLAYTAIYALVRQKWRLGCYLFCFAASVDTGVLFFIPALVFLLLQSCGFLRTLGYLISCIGIQIALALPFIRRNWLTYLSGAFGVRRKDSHLLAINWKFLPEEVYFSSYLTLVLRCAYIGIAILFLDKHFRIVGTIRAVFYRPFKIYKPFPIKADVVVSSLFALNFVGVCFAQTITSQSYALYFLSMPYLLWKTNIPLIFKAKVLLLSEYAYDTIPPTPISSMMLQLANLFTLLTLYCTEEQVEQTAYLDADARQTLINYLNEDCFDGVRMLAIYYGSVTEDLAQRTTVVSIDEREIVLRLPQLRLTLAIGFGSHAPISTVGYGKHVLNDMLTEASEGFAAGETQGSLVRKKWDGLKAITESDMETSQNASLRQRTVAGA